MAPAMDCHFTWETKTPNGICILPDPTLQPERNFCGAHVTVEAFEARARLFCAKRGETFPTLSIQHMIDMLKDKRDAAPTRNERRCVMMEDTTFKLLRDRGVTSKLDYDAAPRQPGRFERNVKGLHHFKIHDFSQHFMKKNIWCADGCHKILDEIQASGPVHGWFIYHDSFVTAATKGTIFYPPKQEEEEEEEEEELRYSSESSGSSGESDSSGGFGSLGESDSSGEGSGSDSSGGGHGSGSSGRGSDDEEDDPPAPIISTRRRTHAVLLFGFGSKGRSGLFDYQNNWGTQRSRGLMETKAIISVIAPTVSFESLHGKPEPAPAECT